MAERELRVGVGHYEQPGFLNPKLYGFWVLPVIDGEGTEREIPGLDELGVDWAAEQMRDWLDADELSDLLMAGGTVLQAPNESSGSTPSIWVCVLNAALETQVESTLTALAMLLERQQMTRDFAGGDLRALPKEAERVDAKTTKLVGEEIRNNGWRSACHAIRARAASSGVSLHVEYKTPMMSVSEIRTRVPMARHVYNTLPGVRTNIDKTVNVLTQNWSISGPAPEFLLREVRDAFDLSGMAVLLAQAVRDGFVCGNGVLSLASVPLKNPWLIRPEDVLELSDESVMMRRGLANERIAPVLPIKGGSQIGSSLGISLLEPFMITAANRDIYLRTLLSAKIMQVNPNAREQVGDWPERATALAEQQLRVIEKSVEDIFNPAVLRMPSPHTALYNPGAELMSPAATRITLGP